ncbi:unnamed protein product [Rotaria sordida]|uniref:Uncharacterized protein n=1 Tax=Rotaria sordida TaxID=392033 RepID=A0A814L5N7_9BILA|nr:unnamed protein product [Rotaria sordida]CAF1475973.1 unnamed protein product [Rotaria sordida]CAF3557234.1 unnamed protein product [Rotaria sordida]CAF3602532.1 unnamed protein product [Rotaria sordida]
MDGQHMQNFVQEQIRKLTKFGGTLREDVIKWLQDTEDVFNRVQLQSANKYIVAQSYLTAIAAIWFRYNKSTVRDWFTFKTEIVKAFPPSLNQKPSSFFSLCLPDPHLENHQLDLVHDDSIKSLENLEVEDLEDKYLHEPEQDHYSPMLVNINDLDREIPHQGESVINSDSVQTDVEDTFEGLTRTMDSLTGNDSLINIVLSSDVQYSWSDKYKPRQPRILNKVHTVYSWNQ